MVDIYVVGSVIGMRFIHEEFCSHFLILDLVILTGPGVFGFLYCEHVNTSGVFELGVTLRP